MEKCQVNLKESADNSYEILIGSNLNAKILEDLKEKKYSKYAIVTDSNLIIYGKKLQQLLQKNNLHCHLISFKAGEQNKTRKTKEEIEDKLISLNFQRDSCIIALGGGVVGDIAGFVAATYMRGIPYIHVPTSLLAMADSSIGGKVGVDTKEGKNMIGDFHQPKKVYIDIDYLKSLPDEEFANGMAEIIKHAIIKDRNFFHFLEKSISKIMRKDADILKQMIKTSCEIKASIVEKDEKEKGIRKLLNYGHTIGHAIESASSYRIKHGFCVAIGMSYAAKLSAKYGFLDEGSVIRQNNLLEMIGLPHRIKHHDLKPKKIADAIVYDKKIINNKINFVFLNSIGDSFVSENASIEDIKKVLEE